MGITSARTLSRSWPADGTYVLTIGNYNDATATISVSVVTPNTTTNALTLGATVTGSLDEPGEADYFTLPAQSASGFTNDALDPATNTSIYVQMISPSGRHFIPTNHPPMTAGPYTLTETGVIRCCKR